MMPAGAGGSLRLAQGLAGGPGRMARFGAGAALWALGLYRQLAAALV